MDDKTTIMLPNEGEYEISTENLKKYNIGQTNIIGNTIFCESDGSWFSMELEDYNKIFK